MSLKDRGALLNHVGHQKLQAAPSFLLLLETLFKDTAALLEERTPGRGVLELLQV